MNIELGKGIGTHWPRGPPNGVEQKIGFLLHRVGEEVVMQGKDKFTAHTQHPMNLTLVSKGRLFESFLPDEIAGKHWIEDKDETGKARRLASIEAHGSVWKVVPFGTTEIKVKEDRTPKEGEPVILDPKEEFSYFILKRPDKKTASFFAEQENDGAKEFTKIGYYSDCTITMGRKADNILSFDNELVSLYHASFTLSVIRLTSHLF